MNNRRCAIKSIRYALCACVAALAVMLAAPAAAEISGDWRYEAADSGAVILGYIGRERTVTIPSQLDGLPVTDIGMDAFYGSILLENVTIPGSVRVVDMSACSDMDNLLRLTIEEGVRRIGADLFGRNDWIERMTFPQGLEEIERSAFSDCRNIRELTLPRG